MDDISRRDALKFLAVAGAATATDCIKPNQTTEQQQMTTTPDPILRTIQLGFQWETQDPFLFCVHHDDAYPAGNAQMGPPRESLVGRDMGQDFAGKDGWRMYHGDIVPGFPQHPHRGFETVTIVRRGLLDHSDSLGAAARFGRGDVQWLTAGRGILHSEMFPLLKADEPNPVELFQIWMNLPRRNKMVAPYFSMLWNDGIPRRTLKDDAGRTTELAIIAGHYDDTKPLPPPPDSWASQENADVAIWTLKMAPGARWTLPAAEAGTNRTLYFFAGSSIKVGNRQIGARTGLVLRADASAVIEAGPDEVELLLLQGRPIGEPVVQHGPFVMNSREEIRQTFLEYQQTRFGGWPWTSDEPVHPRDEGRFARHVDGRVEKPA